MKQEERRDRLLQKSFEVMARQKAEEKHLAASANGMAEAGDLFVSRASGNLPIEWLVVTCEPSRLLVLPVDDSPLEGSRDLEVARPHGTSWVRCGVAQRIGHRAFEPALRTGKLGSAALAAVREHRRSLGTAAVAASPAALDGDEDPDYRAWMADLEEAGARLAEEYPVPEQVVPFVAPRRAVPRRPWRGRFLALGGWAAAAALVVFVVRLEDRIGELQGRIPAERVPTVHPHLPPPELMIQERTRSLEIGRLRVRDGRALLELAQGRTTEASPRGRFQLLRAGEPPWQSAPLEDALRWDLEIPQEWLGGALILQVWGITDTGLEVEVDAWALRDGAVLAWEVGGKMP